jgi:DNA-directed RNA polymerase subunit RPC12/RpoP
MEKKEFECRLCGSKEYEEVRENDGILGSGSSWVVHYVCSGCSVIFKDVEKFSKK